MTAVMETGQDEQACPPVLDPDLPERDQGRQVGDEAPGPSMWEQVCTPRSSVEDAARELADHIGSFIDTVEDPLVRFEIRQRWRAVYNATADAMNAHAGADLLAAREAGMSPQRIAGTLNAGGLPLSQSAVEKAIARAREARSEASAEAVMEP